jgi:hypothetical protein
MSGYVPLGSAVAGGETQAYQGGECDGLQPQAFVHCWVITVLPLLQ